ncbi:MAG: Amuc_1098 family type IV pilus outer membrane protein [Verrucomicrobiota bacterium]
MKQSTSDNVFISRPWHGLPAHAKNDMGWKPMLLALFSIALFAAPTLPAQNLPAASEREIVRRQENLLLANELIAKGDKAVKDKDFETAYVKYLDALDKIPEGPAATAQRGPAVAKFSDAGLSYANFLVQNGRYGDAEKVAKTILLPQFNPGYKPAIQFLAHLEQPDYVNKTVTPQFAASRDEVSKLLAEADGFYATGRFDLAIKRYEQVLNIDRYNNAARMGMEKVNNQKSNYYSEAYNETRSRMLWLVDRAWERPVRRFQSRDTNNGTQSRNISGSGTEGISAKLNRIIIPKIELKESTIREAVERLKQISKDRDPSTDKKGVNIVLKLPSAPATPAVVDPAAPPAGAAATAPAVTPDTVVTMSLSNVPLIEALKYLTELAGLKFKVEPFAVSIVPITENTDELLTKEYRVPPGFIPANSASSADSAVPKAGKPDVINQQRIPGGKDAQVFLTGEGVPFPAGSFAQYVPAGSKLFVRNTQGALDLIDMLVDAAMGVRPIQVEIESKFLEISQNNLKELGFNWLLGPLAIGDGMYGAGGTKGYGKAVDTSTYPFGSIGQNPITGGLRSGAGATPDAAITANSLNALLAGIAPGATSAAPGIFGLSGIFTDPQFQLVIRALNQKKGIDLMSAPKVTTKSGNKAVVKVIRQFPYPTEFSEPQVPPAATGGTTTTGGVVGGVIATSGIVTPTTPTTFETRDLGVTLEVEPQVGSDNYTIDLNLSPEVVEFEGFVNYGSPIVGPTSTAGIVSIFNVTDNVINQPIFSTRKVTTSVSIWDGQTVALGGLIREDVQKTQDKVPILGDIPLAGRLFRSDSSQKIKSNLIIFVTARLMDAEGRPIRQDEEQEEIVEPLGLPENLPPPTFQTRSMGK